MQNKKLPQAFYNRSTLLVARQLLGAVLVHQIGRRQIRGIITETEAYHGPHDKASHASRGRTPRTAVMFGPAGFSYVYLVYGMYHCLNVVIGPVGYPAAVLIRAVEPIMSPKRGLRATLPGGKTVKTVGPGKVCQYFRITKKHNNLDLTADRLWIERGRSPLPGSVIGRSARIGVGYAGVYKNKPWRFFTRGSHFVSRLR